MGENKRIISRLTWVFKRAYKPGKIKIFRKILREILLKWRQRCRYDLEKKIFPKIKNKKVLLVGVANYTADYPKKLRKNDLWTIDINPKVAKFGAKKHIVGSVVEINKFFSNNFFDFIILYGVLGYGLDTLDEAEETMKNCHKVLKEGGILLIGWGPNIPNPPNKIKNIKLFKQVPFFDFSINHKYESREFLLMFLKK